MFQALPESVTFEEFLSWKPDGGRYELHEGVITEMQPTGKHEEITGFLAAKLAVEIFQQKLPYFIPKQALVNPLQRQSGYSPDVLILDSNRLASEPEWEKASTLTKGTTVPLVVEVVSTNWRDDYLTKVRDYEEIGIAEYWIVDYLALGGRRFIGNPKQPTISIYNLVDGEYQQPRQFRQGDKIESQVFSALDLSVEEIFRLDSNN